MLKKNSGKNVDIAKYVSRKGHYIVNNQEPDRRTTGGAESEPVLTEANYVEIPKKSTKKKHEMGRLLQRSHKLIQANSKFTKKSY